MELPRAEALAPRVDTVLQALYLLFNEGYKASQGGSLLRADLCAEAIRLAELLAAHPARRPARDARPARPDASRDRAAFGPHRRRRGPAAAGGAGPARSGTRGKSSRACGISRPRGTGGERHPLPLEAGIAACHCLAPGFAATDWRQIVALYDLLLEQDGSPIVALNRAVAVAQVDGPPRRAGGRSTASRSRRPGTLSPVSRRRRPVVAGGRRERPGRDPAFAGRWNWRRSPPSGRCWKRGWRSAEARVPLQIPF